MLTTTAWIMLGYMATVCFARKAGGSGLLCRGLMSLLNAGGEELGRHGSVATRDPAGASHGHGHRSRRDDAAVLCRVEPLNMGNEPIRLGLIGDNIAASQSPKLHRLAGRQVHRIVSYDQIVPRHLNLDFHGVFEICAAGGYRGVNITYPYKELVTARVRIDDPLVRAMGAVNTVVFEADGPRGFNTDHTGFIAAYRGVRGQVAPGRTLMIGAGGAGRAVAFGLLAIGIDEIAIADRDLAKAQALRDALLAARPDLHVMIGTDADELAMGVNGLVNCTPVGMTGLEGTPLTRAAMAGARWAFDAVYTPVETQFLRDAAQTGLAIISGYELFFGQGIDAWAIFTGLPIDVARLRADLKQPE
jgi:shikimate dehydrogenase